MGLDELAPWIQLAPSSIGRPPLDLRVLTLPPALWLAWRWMENFATMYQALPYAVASNKSMYGTYYNFQAESEIT